MGGGGVSRRGECLRAEPPLAQTVLTLATPIRQTLPSKHSVRVVPRPLNFGQILLTLKSASYTRYGTPEQSDGYRDGKALCLLSSTNFTALTRMEKVQLLYFLLFY